LTKKTQPENGVQFIARDFVATNKPRTQYSPYTPKFHQEVGISLTKQSFAEECDVNNIVAKYAVTGQITHLNTRLADFGEAPNFDFQQAINQVKNAEQMFGQIPAKIRAEFEHNPGKFLEFALNPASLPKMAEMGLIDLVDLPALQSASGTATGNTEPPEAPPLPSA